MLVINNIYKKRFNENKNYKERYFYLLTSSNYDLTYSKYIFMSKYNLDKIYCFGFEYEKYKMVLFNKKGKYFKEISKYIYSMVIYNKW